MRALIIVVLLVTLTMQVWAEGPPGPPLRRPMTAEEIRDICLDGRVDANVDDLRLLALIGAYRDFRQLREVKIALGHDVTAIDARIARIEGLLPPAAIPVIRDKP